MTSFAFIVGCIPLAMASGSGAIARQVMGTAVIGGTLSASALAIFLIPAGFCMVERFSAWCGSRGALRRMSGGEETRGSV
jgi:HAE1 family hydrophobic/amphiphilic exporter-1